MSELRTQLFSASTFKYDAFAKREDFCTIRSAGPPTILDSECPKRTSTCGELHASHIAGTGPVLSQEWTLVCLTPDQPNLVSSNPGVAIPRRPLLLQNVLTGTYATRTGRMDGPNVSLTPSIHPANSTWTFMHAFVHDDDKGMDCFCIVANSTNPCTVDHWAAYEINVRYILRYAVPLNNVPFAVGLKVLAYPR